MIVNESDEARPRHHDEQQDQDPGHRRPLLGHGEAGSSATSGSEPGRAAHSGAEKRQGELGKHGETNATAGAPGDIDPGTETSARHK
jgi:hypothetical protein